MHRTRRAVALAALLAVASVVSGGARAATAQVPAEAEPARPMVFVHGGAGSGAQFESQAMRFASNGYPADYIRVLEYNSANPAGFGAIPAQLDALIADIQADTGADQVDLLGHSLGTGLMQSYLSDPARAANIAHYVNIDGADADAPPGGVPTLALWGQGNPTDEITGATNVHFDDQSHVEVATSRESFREIYKFFNDGTEPATIDIAPQSSDEIEIAGRAVNFPSNDGVQDALLTIYEVDDATGARVGAPVATFPLSGDGSFGPFDADFGKRYEYVITREGSDRAHHLYLPPVIRSDYLVRLLSSPPGQGLDALIERSDGHTALVITRYKEWWGDHPTRSDILMVDGTDVLNAATSPVSKNAIGVFAFDVGSDGTTSLGAPIPTLFGLPFITGVDHFVPAADPTDRTVEILNAPRGDLTQLQKMTVPNWASSRNAVSVQFDDHLQNAEGSLGYVARYPDGLCNAIRRFARGLGLGTPEDLVRLGVDALRDVAEAGGAVPIATPPANDGPCDVLLDWAPPDAAAVDAAATAWGVSSDQLHNAGGVLVVWLTYLAVFGGG